MNFKNWLKLDELDRMPVAKIIKVKSPTGHRAPTRKAVSPSHLGSNPAFIKFDGFNAYGQPNLVGKKTTIKRPSDNR